MDKDEREKCNFSSSRDKFMCEHVQLEAKGQISSCTGLTFRTCANNIIFIYALFIAVIFMYVYCKEKMS